MNLEKLTQENALELVRYWHGEWESIYNELAALKQTTSEYLDETEHLVGGLYAVVSQKRKLLFDRLREAVK